MLLSSHLRAFSSPAEQPQLRGAPAQIVQSLHCLCVPPLDTLEQVHICPVLRTPHLDAVLQVRPHQHRAKGQGHIPQPAGHASFDAAQDMAGFLSREGTLLVHVQLPIHQDSQVLFSKAVLNPYIPSA